MRPDHVIFLEFNELCPPLLDKWMGEGKLPNFKRFYDESAAFVSSPDVDDPLYLEPWIQWYSLHTGLPYEQHRVFHLTDGPKAGHTSIWDVVADSGKPVGSFASMNTKGFSGDGNFYVSDPWCDEEPPYPGELKAYHDFVSYYVQEYTNPDKRLGVGDYARLGFFLLRHGLRIKTVSRALGQLISERFASKDIFWKRVPVLDMIQFDVFRHFFKTRRPTFSTFFVNSTAHLQHTYWRYMEPEAFELKATEAELAAYGDAVLHGYQCMDRLLADFFALEGDGKVMLVLLTALSQQPFLKREGSGGQHFYRPRDIAGLLNRLGIAYQDVEPVMTHQYLLRFAEGQDESEARRRLSDLQLNGESLFGFDDHGEDGLYFGCDVFDEVAADAVISDARTGEEWPMTELLYKIEGIKSGCHHPDGVIWIKSGSHRAYEQKVSILDVFPTVLDLLGLNDRRPEHVRGQSLLNLMAAK